MHWSWCCTAVGCANGSSSVYNDAPQVGLAASGFDMPRSAYAAALAHQSGLPCRVIVGCRYIARLAALGQQDCEGNPAAQQHLPKNNRRQTLHVSHDAESIFLLDILFAPSLAAGCLCRPD